MDKESTYELQLIDANCNDCKFMERDFERLKLHKESYLGTGVMDRMAFGVCRKFEKPVSFIPGVCMIENESCFEHRKEK